jgi:hypothetical protein
MNTDRKSALLSRIEGTFAGVSREGGISLHEATAIDDYASPEQRESARLLDQETKWQDVPDAAVAQNSSVFSFLDTIGLVYYSPVYMSWLIRNGYGTDSNSTEAIYPAVSPWGKWEGGRQLKPNEIFTPEQCTAIAEFLLYVYEVLDEGSSCSSAKEYLDEYWSAHLCPRA